MTRYSPRFLLPLLLVLAACSGAPVETASTEQAVKAQPAPTQGCAWRYLPIWDGSFNALGCAVVQACPGSVLAPLSAGSGGRCELPSFGNPDAAYCDDAPSWQVNRSFDAVVLWQRVDETRPVQYGSWPCGI